MSFLLSLIVQSHHLHRQTTTNMATSDKRTDDAASPRTPAPPEVSTSATPISEASHGPGPPSASEAPQTFSPAHSSQPPPESSPASEAPQPSSPTQKPPPPPPPSPSGISHKIPNGGEERGSSHGPAINGDDGKSLSQSRQCVTTEDFRGPDDASFEMEL